MPWGPNSSKKYSWKETAGGGRNRNERERSWRKTDVGSSKNTERSFISRLSERGVFRIVGSVCSALICIALIVWLWMLPGCTQTEILVVTFPGDAEGIAPPKHFARNDADAFDQVRRTLKSSGENVQWDELEDYLDAVDRDKVLVLFISAHGVTGIDGNAYLLPNKADPDKPESYLSLKKLWTTLNQNKDQKKLVLLDICQLRNEWRMGLFDNGVLDRIESGIQGVPNLVVVSSCSPGEKSWAGNDMPDGQGQSVFGHYVVQGLQGHADADENQQLTLKELYEYVTRHTNNWVSQNRDRSGQNPQLYSSVDRNEVLEWEITSLPRSNAPDSAGTGKPGRENLAELNRRIQKAWLDREELEKQSPYQFDPLGWRVLTDRLLQAEDWLDAGNSEGAATILGAVSRGLERVQKQVQQGRFENFRENYPFVYENIVRRIWNDLQPSNGNNADSVTKRPENYLLEDLCRDQSDVTKLMAKNEAVPIRRQAENAASSSLRTLQPVREMILEADEARRTGEDYLFVPDSETARKYLEDAKAKYVGLQANLRAAEIAGDVELDITGRRFTLIEPPVLPLGPNSPNRPVIVVIGFLLALAIGAGCVAMAEVVDDSIRGAKKLADIVGSPPLVVIPYLNNSVDITHARINRMLLLTALFTVGTLCVFYVLYVIPQL
ncbi:MAG: hypothetical protein IH899_13890 [Planctomycetes bacterium]|nr:hypothetical protein [Planctomycetota bacterium]